MKYRMVEGFRDSGADISLLYDDIRMLFESVGFASVEFEDISLTEAYVRTILEGEQISLIDFATIDINKHFHK